MITDSILWNRLRYTVYTPFYNIIESTFSGFRKKAIEQLNIKTGDRILILGAGTGLDLDFIGKDAEVTAIDITPAMIDKLNSRAKKLGINVNSFVMDGQKLLFESEHFDYVILHLILAVIPDPYKTINEAVRVLKPGGKISILDKFLKKDEKPSAFRRFMNFFARIFFTDINRRLEDILKDTSIKILSEEPVLLNGLFKIVIACKQN